jgi:protoporphyrinogen/coproporphyrinogen III oxidase
MSHRRRVTVVGGGVTGLTLAYRLTQAEPAVDVTVLEAGDHPGGKLASLQVGDLTLPAGADSFLARKPWAVALCKELGVELEAPGDAGAHLWTDHGLVPLPKEAPFGIPGEIGQVFRWPGLTSKGRRRALQDLLRKKRKDGVEETLGGLLRRRLGDEATDRAVGPLLAGLYAGDVDRLSVRETFPDLERWEAWQGSLIRGAQAATRQSARGTPGPMFVRPRGGVDRLTDVLASRLGPAVRTGAPVRTVEELDADAIVLALPAHDAARVLEEVSIPAATELAAIPYASTGVVLLVYGDDTQRGVPEGTGFVVPRGRAPMTAATWLSSKWPSDAFGSRAVVRCFVGAVGEEDILDADDSDLVDACTRHLAALVSLPERAERAAVVRWPRSMPQYEVGHRARVERIRSSLPPGIFVVGQAYDGVGVPDCVHAAGETAGRVLEHLERAAQRAPSDEETVR